MVLVIRRNRIQVVFLRSYLCRLIADGVRNEIIMQVRASSVCFSLSLPHALTLSFS